LDAEVRSLVVVGSCKPERPVARVRGMSIAAGSRSREASMPDIGTIPDDPATWTADEAVTALYTAYWPGMVRLARLLTHDASVAEEIVQDAFVALHGRWHRLLEPAAAHGYLRTSVINGARSALRHRNVVERHYEPGPAAAAGPEEHALRSVEDARVLAALRTLPRRQQEVLVLRYYADLSEHDIAASLGISRGAVKSHAHRGLAALRAALAAGMEVTG
jgi:RNA polymerase sigma-70 factor (sigma-E family)